MSKCNYYIPDAKICSITGRHVEGPCTFDFYCDSNIPKEETKMSVKNTVGTREWYVEQIQAVGESLMKNAESLVGTEPGKVGIDITVYINPQDQTEIRIEKRLIPEKLMKE